MRLLLLACCMVWWAAPLAAQGFLCVGHAPVAAAAKAAQGGAVRPPVLPASGRLQVLTVFARFADEPPTPVPAWADRLFAPDLPGSFAHFYRTMSFGRLHIEGRVLPRRYAAAGPAADYRAAAPGQNGRYGDFVREILAQVDADVDLGQFDNDGPDGRPNSGDDDGWVDYLFVNMQSVPEGFLLGPATGLVGLGLGEAGFVSGAGVRVSGAPSQGAVQETGNFAQTVGAMAHEFGHSLGLPDFFDTSFFKRPSQGPAADSGGIGRWGLMGWGAHGWDGLGGPVAFSARSLEQLGWIGAADGRLVEVGDDRAGLLARDLLSGGSVYKIPLRAETPDNVTLWVEYLLLEYRDRSAHYYHRGQPASGLLVWHVKPQVFDNDDEQHKHLDLVAADGRYLDGGFPLGQEADAYGGGDNLDYWAHDVGYTRAHGGNLGDATDLFDGVRYRRLGFDSNPTTLSSPTLAGVTTGLALEHMRRAGDGLALDVVMPRWAGVLREEVHWAGEVLVDGDLTVAPEGRVVVFRNAQVKVAGSDRLGAGVDPARTEIRVQGDFVIRAASVSQVFNIPQVDPDTTRFAAAVSGEQWAGIFIESATRSELSFPLGSYEVRDAVRGLVVDGPPPVQESLVIRGFLAEQRRDAQGRGIYEPGERIPLALKMENLSALTFLTDARAFIRWDSPLLEPQRARDQSRTISFPAGEKSVFFVFGRTPTLSEQAEPGSAVEFTVWIQKDGAREWGETTFSIVVAGSPTAVGEPALPTAFALDENYPNPFNAATTIGYSLPRAAAVELDVFNASGQRLRRLVRAAQVSGVHRAVWDGRDDAGRALATGVYFYRLRAGRSAATRRMVLLR